MSVLRTQYIKFFDCIHFNFYLNKIKHDTYCVQKHTLLKRWGINRRANESPYFILSWIYCFKDFGDDPICKIMSKTLS